MARSYKLSRDLTFDESTGYWDLRITVVSSENVPDNPFLLEKAVLGTDNSNTLQTSQEPERYLKTLLSSEVATNRLVTDEAVYNKFTWVQYRSNEFTRSFYTYAQAVESASAVEAVLKANARVYTTPSVAPRLIGTNLSSKEKKPSLESLTLTKGDTISLQLVNGPSNTELITDGAYIKVSREDQSTRRKSNSYLITITDTASMTYVGLRDMVEQKDYKLAVSINATPLEGQNSEVII